MSTKLTVENCGRVKQLTFPAGWIEDTPEQLALSSSDVLSVRHPELEKVKLGLFYRGVPVNRYIAVEFLTVLQMAPHVLTEYEMEIVAPVLRTMADTESFAVESLETIDVNGCTALKVEGLWLNSGLWERGLFFNGDSTGEFVQEIHFFAPKADFDRCEDEVNSCLSTISWN